MSRWAAPEVEIRTGRLAGIRRRGVLVFRGVPYAAAPVGARRWLAPAPPPPWPGVRAADRFAASAPQNPSALELLLGGAGGGREDCLYLNVWTPSLGGRLPVLVWLHGGGFTTGSGSIPWYDGAALAARGAVVVTLNYRLGVFGFCHLADVVDQPDERVAAAGNAGLLDQAEALRWVQANIAVFGGDPARVALFGESAGAMCVAAHLALPASAGTFTRAIAQSGAAANVSSRERAAAVAHRLLEELGCEPGRGRRLGLDALQALPTAALLDAQQRVNAQLSGPGGLAFQPVLDGEALGATPLDALAAGAAPGVELLVGANRHEMRLFFLNDPSAGGLSAGAAGEAELLRRLERSLAAVGASADPADAAARYRETAGRFASPVDLWIAHLSDRVFHEPARRLADAAASAGRAVRTYLFDYPTPAFAGRLGACHALELPFVFDNLDAPGANLFVGPLTGAVRRLAGVAADAWVAFADGGSTALSGWAPGGGEHGPVTTLLDGAGAGAAPDPLAELRKLWV
ncbi:MAG: carboxylesterase/lipase family protein [Acidimicrobiales bacterium]